MKFVDTADAASIVVLVLLMALSAFFSGSETALVSCNRIRIRTMAEDGNKRAATLLGVLDQQSKMITDIAISKGRFSIKQKGIPNVTLR